MDDDFDTDNGFQGKCSFVWEYGIRVLPISLFPMVSRVIIMEMERLRNLYKTSFLVNCGLLSDRSGRILLFKIPQSISKKWPEPQ